MKNEDASGTKVVLEQNKRLSESIIWTMEREYFQQKGINAWVNELPFYITSNPFIANCYAKITVSFIRDWLAKNPESIKHPFYIIELGTGAGRFSYYTLKAIHEICHELKIENISIVYVMTDFTKNNLEFYQTHHALAPFIEKGLLDFAIYDIQAEQPIQLLLSNKELNSKTLENPLIIYSNYVFDTIPCDSFSAQHGRLYELAMTLTTEKDNMDQNNHVIDLQKIDIKREVNEIELPYYNDPALDNILALYQNELIDSSFLMPAGTIRGLKWLKELSNNKLLLITSDKAYSVLSSLDNLNYPSLSFHGSSSLECFSMMVNLHAIGEYMKNSGGDYFASSLRKGLKTCVFSSNFNLADFVNTHTAITDHVEKFGPSDYFNCAISSINNNGGEHLDLEAIASILQMSQWDPYIYTRLSSRISILMDNAEEDTLTFLINNMKTLAENYYYLPKSECVLFEIGVFYHALKRYEEALEYYQKVSQYTGEQFGLAYNIALCYHHCNQNDLALIYFQQAAALNKESKETQEWVEYLEKMESSSPAKAGDPESLP